MNNTTYLTAQQPDNSCISLKANYGNPYYVYITYRGDKDDTKKR